MCCKAWRCRARIAGSKDREVIGSFMKRDGRCYIIPENGDLQLIPVDEDSVRWELDIKDKNGTPLYEGDSVMNPESGEVYALQFDTKFPFSHINPFALPRPEAVVKIA